MRKLKGYKDYLFLLGAVLLLLIFLGGNLKTEGNVEKSWYPELAELEDKNLSFKEFADYFTRLAEDKGAKYAFDVLRVVDAPSGIDMHLAGHIVGGVLYRQEGAAGIRTCTHDFRNACSHSIVIGLLLEKGEQALREIADACRQAPGGKGAYGLCFHGLGHGVLAYTEYELPKAVEFCQGLKSLQGTGVPSIECIGGTVMEMVGGVHDREVWEEKSQKYLSATDPLFPCTASFMPPEARPICFTYLTPQMWRVAGASPANPEPEHFSKVFEYCSRLTGANRSACFGGQGKEFIVLASSRDIRDFGNLSEESLKKIYRWCSLAKDPEGVSACLSSALRSLYWGGENDYRAALLFCKLTPEPHKTACFEELIGTVYYYKESYGYRAEFCKSLPQPFQENCLGRLGSP